MKKDYVYRLIDSEGNIIYEGSYSECLKREADRIEYVGVKTPIYHATSDTGVNITGTVREISEKLHISYLTLYNYTRYKRQYDGLFLEKVEE